MIPGLGLDPRALKKMMKQMGMEMEDIEATEVIIKKTDGKEIKISRPQIQKMSIPGQGDSFQITGNSHEEIGEPEITEDDINLVAEQAKVPKAKAKEALEKNNGDIAKAILELQK